MRKSQGVCIIRFVKCEDQSSFQVFFFFLSSQSCLPYLSLSKGTSPFPFYPPRDSVFQVHSSLCRKLKRL